MNNIPILSFYSGGGFLDMGFEMAGFTIVWNNENDSTFSKLHAAGLGSWRKAKGINVASEKFNNKSITDISNNEIIEEAFPNGIPEDFGIIGGPPCQDFSLNGRKKGFNGDRGKLTVVFFDKIFELQPTFFLMENVTGLLKNNSNKKFLFKILEQVKKSYFIDFKVLNSINFGVPQSRERVFFIGIRKDKLQLKNFEENSNWFNWPVNNKYDRALERFQWPSPGRGHSDFKTSKDTPKELCVGNLLVPRSKLNTIPNANEFCKLYTSLEKLNKIEEGETNRPSFKRLHRNRYSPTACYGNNEVHLHPTENRRLSVRETLRIQGVPDSYILPSELNLSKKFKMIGNGVPVPLSHSIAEAIKSFLIENEICM